MKKIEKMMDDIQKILGDTITVNDKAYTALKKLLQTGFKDYSISLKQAFGLCAIDAGESVWLVETETGGDIKFEKRHTIETEPNFETAVVTRIKKYQNVWTFYVEGMKTAKPFQYISNTWYKLRVEKIKKRLIRGKTGEEWLNSITGAIILENGGCYLPESYILSATPFVMECLDLDALEEVSLKISED